MAEYLMDENINRISKDLKHGEQFKIGRFCEIQNDVIMGSNVVIGDYTKIMPGTKIGDNVVIGDYTKIMPGTKIGDNVVLMDYVKLMPDTVIGNNCKIDDYANTSGYVEIGNNVRIKRCSMIGQAVRIEDDVWVGSHVTTTRIKYPKVIQEEKEEEEWITLKKGCMTGSASIILAGTTVGEGAVIGAGSVVTKDCEPNGVYVGNPATFRRYRVR